MIDPNPRYRVYAKRFDTDEERYEFGAADDTSAVEHFRQRFVNNEHLDWDDLRLVRIKQVEITDTIAMCFRSGNVAGNREVALATPQTGKTV